MWNYNGYINNCFSDNNSIYWLKISDAPVPFDAPLGDNKMNLTCTTTLAGLRTCKVKMDDEHDSHALMPRSGGPYKVWIKAWNSKGTAGWSFPEEFNTTGW